MKVIKPFASWTSTITAKVLANQGHRFGHMALDNGLLYWLEIRPAEKGRGVLMCAGKNQKAKEVLPQTISVRTRVHEYGGGDFLVCDGVVYFSNAQDNCIYQFDGELKAITSPEEGVECRYADFCIHPQKEYLFAVKETHHADRVSNELVSISLHSQQVDVLHAEFDFYSFPRISNDGQRVCWTCWNQPDMPWDGAQLWLADLHKGARLDAAHRVSGGDSVAIFQPEWSKDDVLHYVSDASNWSNIYSHHDGILNALTPIDREFATPQWVFGLATYIINDDSSLYALYFESGQQQLCHIDTSTGHIEPIALPFKHFSGALLGDSESLYFCGAGPAIEAGMYRYDIESKKFYLLNEQQRFPLAADDISVARPITFESANKRICHAFFYSPKSSEFQSPEGSKPPLIVMSHGGPTAYSDNSLDPSIQFWTNRGFAVVDVNYGGSTGFGKRYRELLTGQWGIVDVEDCVAAARYLTKEGLVDPKALLIRGGSAGGYTTLCALTYFDVFAAGMSRYGVADLESLAADSHKFEARYLDKMVGPYPQAKAVYQARSPIHHTDKLSCPILLLQGADDKVVPPNQAEQMVKALQKKGIPYAYLLFEGEGHGFRQAETIVNAFNAELYFYRKILGIESDEKIPEIEIHNL